MMEFRDQDGCRRFFRFKDQLKVANNSTLKFIQKKFSPKFKMNKNSMAYSRDRLITTIKG